MAQNDLPGQGEKRQFFQKMATMLGMQAHHIPPVIRQAPRLEQNRIRHADLANVMQQAAPVNLPQHRFVGVVVARQDQRVGATACAPVGDGVMLLC